MVETIGHLVFHIDLGSPRSLFRTALLEQDCIAMSLEEEILTEVAKDMTPSAYSLSRIILGDEADGHRDLYYPGYRNLVIWTALNSDFVDAVLKLLVEKKIYALPTAPFVVKMDGAFLELPVAEALKDYSSRTWLPVVFSTKDNPDAERSLSPDAEKGFWSLFDSVAVVKIKD